jgi:hypothetical protein
VGLDAILASGVLLPSTKTRNPHDVRFGDGQYLSDIPPGTMTSVRLCRRFFGRPYPMNRFTHYIEIDVGGLRVVAGRPGVFVIPNQRPLDLTCRVIQSGAN